MEYKRTLTDDEVSILNNDLLDIKDWIDKAVACHYHLVSHGHERPMLTGGYE